MNILVVDDEVNARTALAELLRDEGFEVETAADAFKALGAVPAAKRLAARALGDPATEGFALAAKSKLLAAVGGAAVSSDLAALWKSLAEEVRILAGVSFASLAETGLVLNSADFANLNFPEGETLHFKPAAKPAVATA